MRLNFGDYSVQIDLINGCWIVHDLQGSGDPADLLRLLRRVKEESRSKYLVLHVDADSGIRDRLVSLYERMGAERRAVILTIGEPNGKHR